MKPIHLVLAASCLLAACKEKDVPSSAASSAQHAAPSEALKQILAASPAGAPKDIHLVRATVHPGDEVTLGGRIMGNEKPFVEGRAVFILGDPTVLTACNEKPGDKCETPWDNCCNTKEEKKVALATIQVVGADGRVLKEDLEGAGGLKKLGRVTVTGKVAEGSTADALVVNATAIRAEP